MTTTDRDRIIDRIRKLMAFNDRTATEAEVENAMALASGLMERHAIDRADVEDAAAAAGAGEGVDVVRTRGRSPLRRNLATWEATLMAAVRAAVPGVSSYTDTDEDPDDPEFLVTMVVWYGPEDAVEVARVLFDETRLIIASLAAGIYGGCYRGRGRSYAEGFAHALWQRMQREREASAEHERVTAIVRRDEERNTQWLADEHGVELMRRPRRRGGRHDPSAFAHGERDGTMHELSGIRPKLDA